ncbi:glycosyltransferase family 9 protein [Celerinatantimonas yamalensis]|uniref:Glycosyltransferase family 9 protein n=1 Tax=Celerinatantimonas yamalensis TaxID=559956 RepID=A0ABW9GFF4_9GAMM
MQPTISTPTTICIIRLSAIGDVCNAATLINRIRMQWHDANITWICGPAEAQLLKLIPNITIVCFDKKAGLNSYRQVYKALHGRQFELLLHLQASLRASLLSVGIKARRRIGYHRSRAYELQWLFTREKTDRPKGLHVVDNYQAFADYLQCPAAPVSWPFVIPESAQTQAAEKLKVFDRPFIVICPAASKAYKNWSIQGYAAVIQALQAQHYPIVLVGGPAPIELQVAQQIQTQLSQPVLNWVGQTSLAELMVILAQAKLLITPDTGPAHMASAMHTPVVGLYAHHNPLRVGPYGSITLAVNHWPELIEKQTGKPPEQLPWRSRVKDKHAMLTIMPDEVLLKVQEALSIDETTAECEPLNQSY